MGYNTKWNILEAMEYYQKQGAPQNQSALVELLREIQEENGGSIPSLIISEVAQHYGIKESFLSALIKRYPSLRTQEAPHRMEVCGDQRCQRQNCAKLHTFIEKEFDVHNGGISATGKFTYRVVSCMKNCGKGPSLKWDGTLYPFADPELVLKLVKGDSDESAVD